MAIMVTLVVDAAVAVVGHGRYIAIMVTLAGTN
jgi:hypothetical protein